MPSTSIVSPITAHVFRSPFHLLASHLSLFKSFQEEFNIMFPQMGFSSSQEINGTLANDVVWITCSSGIEEGNPDLILSCTEDSRGNKLPVFIASSRPISMLQDQEYLVPRLSAVVEALYEEVDSTRVFSVFGMAPITVTFAKLWAQKTGISCEPLPYYSATYARCTRQTFKNRQYTILGDATYEMRLAMERDMDALTDLCYDFALTSPPFVMTREQASEEASYLISHRRVWVHTINRPNAAEEIASIVAVTRESVSVSAITKVYTNPRWRGKRCAERLVRHVTKMLLSKPNKESVVLYVGLNNPARKVYQRVGFTGPGGELLCDDSVNAGHWLELGFDQKKVELGLW